jgi:hypothetical protein
MWSQNGSLPKIAMWVIGNCNLPYVGQHTNVVIENYHANLKATLRSSKGMFHGRWIDWAIYALVGDVLIHYWYNALWQSHGFVINKKQIFFVINVVIKAKMIPDSCVTLPSTPFGVALVMSKKHPPNKYWVHNPKSKWASCDYPWAQHGNICKH